MKSASTRSNQARDKLRVADNKWVAAAKKLSGAQWRTLLNATKMPPSVIVDAGQLIWWDFLADRPVKDRDPEFDDLILAYRQMPVRASVKAVRLCLVSVGYPEHRATDRVSTRV